MLPDNNPWLSLACKVRCYWFPITSLWLLRSWIISGVSARWRPLLDTHGTTSPQLYWTFLKKHADGAKLICTASCCAQRSGDSDTSPSCTGEMSTCPGVTLTGEPASCVCVCVFVFLHHGEPRACHLRWWARCRADLCVVSALCCTPLRWEVPALQMFHDVQMGGSQGVLLTSGHFDRLSPQPGPAHDSWSPPPPPRITTTERCEGGGWAYHHIGSRSWRCP